MVYSNKLIEGQRHQPPRNARTNPEIVLKGVNFSGLQYREPTWGSPEGQPSHSWWEAAGITEKRIQEIAKWGAKIMVLESEMVDKSAQDLLA
jgi:hypothetical protein